MSTIHKSDLQRIIREEYARVLLEQSGHRVTDARVRLIAEKIENGDLDEGLGTFLKTAGSIFGDIGKAGAKKAGELGGAVKQKAGELGQYAKGKYAEQEKKEQEEKKAKAKEKIASRILSFKDEIKALRQERDTLRKAAVDDIAELLLMTGEADESNARSMAGNLLNPQGKGKPPAAAA